MARISIQQAIDSLNNAIENQNGLPRVMFNISPEWNQGVTFDAQAFVDRTAIARNNDIEDTKCGIYLLINCKKRDEIERVIAFGKEHRSQNLNNIKSKDYFGRFNDAENRINYSSRIFYIGKANHLKYRLDTKWNNDKNAVSHNLIWPSTVLFPNLNAEIAYLKLDLVQNQNNDSITLAQLERLFFGAFMNVFEHKILGNWRHINEANYNALINAQNNLNELANSICELYRTHYGY
jgi:hypothetical protein